MKKTFASLLLISAIALTGCSSSGEPAQESTAGEVAAAAGTSIPKPDAKQEVQLIEALEKINPALNNEDAIDNARNQCTALLDGVAPDRLISGTQARFESAGVETVTERDAMKILEAIKNNGFCK